jgi:hypothetical protein
MPSARASIGASDAATVTTPVISVADAVASEGQGYVELVVRLDAPSTQTVTVTVHGTNDIPVISSGVQSGSVTEDGTLTASGQVTATDVDHDAVLEDRVDAAQRGPFDRRLDAHRPDSTGDVGEVTGNRSDTIMVLRLDNDTDEAALLSIPRDLYIDNQNVARYDLRSTSAELSLGLNLPLLGELRAGYLATRGKATLDIGLPLVDADTNLEKKRREPVRQGRGLRWRRRRAGCCSPAGRTGCGSSMRPTWPIPACWATWCWARTGGTGWPSSR